MSRYSPFTKAIVLALFFLIYGCGVAQTIKNTNAEAKKIRVGMTKEEVEKILWVRKSKVETIRNSLGEVTLIKWYRINFNLDDKTPYLYKEGKLIGWGKDFLKAERIKLEAERIKRIEKSEADFKKILDENDRDLDSIEGIWIDHSSVKWKNLLSGISGSSKQSHYRIAIIQDTTNSNYEFTGVTLESDHPSWQPEMIKTYFRKTAHKGVYEGLWFMGDYSERKEIWHIDETGVLKTSFTSQISEEEVPFEIYYEFILVKAYPPLNEKSRLPRDKGVETEGSGFLLSGDGLVVTNFHVVEGASRIEVFFPAKGITKNAIIKIKDTQNDIAILELMNFSYSDLFPHDIPFNLGDVSAIKVGHNVFTLGFPLGKIMGRKARLSTGHINSLFGIQDDPRLFQISNPIQPGNSGGPLFNSQGEIVGIVIATLNAKFFYEKMDIIPQNVNFAIKANYLKNLISMLPKGDRVIKRSGNLKNIAIEEQIEKITPFIVKIKIY